MRQITHIVIHCSATRPDLDVGAEQIRVWHRGRGWSDIGYHYVVRRSGAVEAGRPLERAGAHVAGHNAKTIGVCLVGGVDATGLPQANYTPGQWAALEKLVGDLCEQFPAARVCGHRDFPGVAKACPCFDAGDWARALGLGA